MLLMLSLELYQDEYEENCGKEEVEKKEKNGNTGLEPFNVTLVTMEELDSSSVTLVNYNATLVTIDIF